MLNKNSIRAETPQSLPLCQGLFKLGVDKCLLASYEWFPIDYLGYFYYLLSSNSNPVILRPNIRVQKNGCDQHNSNSQSKKMRRQEVTNQNNCEWFWKKK